MFDLSGKKIWVAGHRGMVGSALCRALETRLDVEVLTVGRDAVDLRNQAAVTSWVQQNKPDAIIIAAAVVGGIEANRTRPVEFLHDNIMIESNIFQASFAAGVENLVFLASSCTYPVLAEQPIAEASLLTGVPEPTNQWYSVAKIAGVKLAEAYRQQHGLRYFSVVPANLYGPGDNFDLAGSHVIPALLRKAHEAKVRGDSSITIWGSGKPLREFMFVDDCAEIIIDLLGTYDGESHINVGTGSEIAIGDLARLVCTVVGLEGGVVLDTHKPDGAMRKVLDCSRMLELGYRTQTPLEGGLRLTYDWFLKAGYDRSF